MKYIFPVLVICLLVLAVQHVDAALRVPGMMCALKCKPNQKGCITVNRKKKKDCVIYECTRKGNRLYLESKPYKCMSSSGRCVKPGKIVQHKINNTLYKCTCKINRNTVVYDSCTRA